MKHFIFFVAACFCNLLCLAQTQTITVGTLDARKGIYVPRLTTLPTAKPGFLVYKTTGADSGLYIGSISGSTWNKVFPGSGGSYTGGNGIRITGNTIALRDTLSAPVNLYYSGSTTSAYSIKNHDPAGGTASNSYQLFQLGQLKFLLQSLNTGVYRTEIFGELNGLYLDYLRSSKLSSIYLQVTNGTANVHEILMRTDTVRITGINGVKLNPVTNLNRYNLLAYDTVTKAVVSAPKSLLSTGSTIDTTSLSVRINQKLQEVTAGTGITTMPYGGSYNGVIVNADTAGIIASKANVANQIAAATLSTIPGVIDVQDVQNGGLRCTNCSTQTFTDSSYLTKRKADELYAGASISSRSSSVEEFYDFYSAPTTTQGGSNGLSVNATGSGTSASTVTSPAANRPGILSLSTGTTATGRTTLYNASGMNMLVIGGGYFTTGIDVRHPTLYAAGEDYFTVFGLMSSTGKDQTNGIYVLYDAGGTTTGSAASANYQFVTANAGTRLFTTTSVPVASGTASDFQRLRIEVTPAGDTARLYIGGTLAATHTGASLPAGANLSLTASITKYGVGTTARTMQIDWIDWRYLFTTPR
ncbi:hypothetical protein [Phnomibacter sp. MR]|uniref:hypothetical protein n=1 Tax=Phnomibacter sp. MR TaxID=3042318 RepID=UPI003A800D62